MGEENTPDTTVRHITCKACWDTPGDEPVVVCDTCGSYLHESCAENYQQFHCSRCGEELWIGAVEF